MNNRIIKTSLIILTSSLLMGCSINMNNLFNENHLVIASLPTKTEYKVGEFFYPDGLEVTDKDGKEVKSYTIRPEEGTKFLEADVGTVTVTVSKQSYKSVYFTITVSAKDMDPIEEAKENAINEINEYYASFDLDEYDSEGRSSLLSIKNNAIASIREVSTINEINQIVSNAKASMDAVSKRDVDPNRKLQSINVTRPHSKYYRPNDEINLNGLYVTASYDNGDNEQIFGYTLSDVDMSKVGRKDVEVTYKGKTASFTIDVVNKRSSGTDTVKILATNDIHGQVYEANNRAGIGKTMTYISRHKDDNTLILDQGDTWQGSIYSNTNRGALINDVMNYVQYDARIIGNHDFDWGQEYIQNNKESAYLGYSMPVLGANLYDYNFETKETGEHYQDTLAQPTVSYVLENGLKVGIVGTIGEDQITSIMTKYVEDITFTDHVTTIKSYAEKLRQEGCDIVIASIHAGQEDVLKKNLGNSADLVLCAHTHRYEISNEGDLYFAQFGSYTSGVGEISLTYDYSLDDVSETSINYATANTIMSEVTYISSPISSIIDEYVSQISQDPDEVIVNNASGSFYSNTELPNMMCKAIYHQAELEGIDIDLAYCNEGRYSLYKSSWTYADIYQAFPFDNHIYVIEVPYSEVISEIVGWNSVYWSPDFDGQVGENDKIRVAAIDFLAFHTNSNRRYDYFPTVNGEYIDVLSLTYRDIFVNWLKDSGYDKGKPLYSYRFNNGLTQFSKNFNQPTSKVEFYNGDELYSSQYVCYEQDLYLYFPENNPVNGNKTFTGWYMDPECTIGAVDYVINSGTTKVYAGWN